MRSIKGLKVLGHTFKDKPESEAIEFIVKTAKDFGPKLTMPILIDLMK
jgi:hypothetical protein